MVDLEAWLAQVGNGPMALRLLPLLSAAQAHAFLKQRLPLVAAEARGEYPGRLPRARRLLDRSAAFWLVIEELERRPRPHGVCVLAPSPSTVLPRLFDLNAGFGLGHRWDGEHPLARRVAFCQDALQAFGALVVPFPPQAEAMDQSYGPGTGQAMAAQAAKERGQRLAATWNKPPALTEPLRERL